MQAALQTRNGASAARRIQISCFNGATANLSCERRLSSWLVVSREHLLHVNFFLLVLPLVLSDLCCPLQARLTELRVKLFFPRASSSQSKDLDERVLFSGKREIGEGRKKRELTAKVNYDSGSTKEGT